MLYCKHYYLDKPNAKFLGVCSGFATYTDLPVFLVRLGLVILTLAHLGFMTVPAYFITALVAHNRPTWRNEDYDTQQPRDRSRFGPSPRHRH